MARAWLPRDISSAASASHSTTNFDTPLTSMRADSAVGPGVTRTDGPAAGVGGAAGAPAGGLAGGLAARCAGAAAFSGGLGGRLAFGTSPVTLDRAPLCSRNYPAGWLKRVAGNHTNR